MKKEINEVDSKIPLDFQNTAQTLGSKATFLAGFSYYQIGRYGFTPATDTSYIVFCTLAFVSGVLTAGMAGIMLYYLDSLPSIEKKMIFCEDVRIFQRNFSRLFIFGSFNYLLALGRIGFVYYPESDMKWFVFIVMIITVILFIYGIIYVVKCQLSLQFHIAKNKFNVSKQDLEKLKEDNTNLNPDDIVKKFPEYSERLGDRYDKYFTQESNTISTRALFIAGLAQNGIMRFSEFTLTDNYLGQSFIVFSTIATASAFLAGIVLIWSNVFLIDTETNKQLAFSILLAPLLETMLKIYMISYITIAISILVMGWGTGSLATIVINYSFISSYEIYGALNILLLISVAYAYIKKESMKNSNRESKIIKKATIKDENINLLSFNESMNRNNSAGGMSTFAAGYVFYNIVTFATDVFNQPPTSETNVYSLNYLFLIVNLSTVVIGLCSAILDSIISLFCNEFPESFDRVEYLYTARYYSKLIVWGYKITLIGWFIIFSLFGFVKTQRVTYIPLSYSIIGLIIAFSGSQYLSKKYEFVKFAAINNKIEDDSIIMTSVIEANLKRPTILSRLGFTIFFLGGFAYYAIDFFVFKDRIGEDIFLHSFSLCFITSVWVLFWGNDYVNKMSYCRSLSKKIHFAEITYNFFIFTLCIAVISLLSILIGFSYLGNMKFIENYEDVTYIIAYCTYVTILLILISFYWIHSKYKQTLNTLSMYIENVKFDYKSFISKLRMSVGCATFVSGNVCYELLFSEALSTDYYNKYYFLMTTVCFSTGIIATSITIFIETLIDSMNSEELKIFFANDVRIMKNNVFYLMYVSMLSWLLACIALGEVKYKNKENLWLPVRLKYILKFIYISF